jgi:hypothetical protein
MEMINVKAMPGSIPAPNSGLIMEKKKNIGSQMGQNNKKTLKIIKKNYEHIATLKNSDRC